METALSPIMCDYATRTKCDLVYLADVRNVMNNRNNSEELKYYWEEYRRKNDNIGHYVFPEFVDLWVKAANDTRETPVEFLYNSYADGTMSTNIQIVMDELMPFYKEFHAHVRHKLNKKYGDNVVFKTGLIPHHLFEILTLQAWKKESPLEHAYPEKRLPNILAGMEKEGLDADKIVQIAEDYYKSMGFEPLSEKIKTNFQKLPGKKSASVECRGQVYDQTPNVRMEYCPQVHFKKFLQMHGYLGRVHYGYEKRDLPFSMFNSYNFEDAVGEAIILSASCPENIVKQGFVSETTYTKELDMNRLFRMGVHTMFNIPVYYVHVKLFEDLLNGVTNFDDINIHYWNLMEKYAGVEPPFDRNYTSFDLPVKFYEDIQLNRLVTKFVSEILGYQIYDSLCKIANKYGENAETADDLHNCNLEGSVIVGQVLHEMMSKGSKKPWRKILEIVTGNDQGISSVGVLNYYKPLREWLQRDLQSNGIIPGWDKSNRVLDGNRNSPGLLFRSYDLPTIRFNHTSSFNHANAV
ncbi:angiotensin-converting enzyme-like [Condylostylus longicornis]|uniref:angiotensin-converting enzyme-like n=1 Tax=Condylostylus longicornis TaxID=2530218 RepID=UPI00244E43C3|nr:angiotensin-converting enzyme-like [Condylostylus longicornis]